jgi:hypothetical protein
MAIWYILWSFCKFSPVLVCFTKKNLLQTLTLICQVYEGLQNIRNLIYLKELDLSYSPLIDAWCMDRITGEFGESLEVLNLSGCHGIDW